MSKSRSKTAVPALAQTAEQLARRNDAALTRVSSMSDPDGLRNLIANARRLGVEPVRAAAFRRLALVQAEAETGAGQGTVENAVWQMIHAVEQIKREEAGKAVRLNTLRREIRRLGAAGAIGKLVSSPGPSERFEDLMARSLPGYTAEAIVLAHPDAFDDATRAAATARLEGAGVDPATLMT